MNENSKYKEFLDTIKLFNHTSQFGEDSIIEAIFSRIGILNKWCMECGAADGLFFSNTRKLIEEGWSSVQIEADPTFYEQLRQRYGQNQNVHTINELVGLSNGKRIDDILERVDCPIDLDLMVIDVDGQDYHLWNSLIKYKPRVLVIEHDPNVRDRFIPEVDGNGQAGIESLNWMAVTKGYVPICATQTNFICIRIDIVHLIETPKDEVKSTVNQQALSETIKEESLQNGQHIYKGLTYTRNTASTTIEVEDVTSGNKEKLRIVAVTSTPRQGFTAHTRLLYSSLALFNIPLKIGGGMWWEQALQNCIEDVLNDNDIIITIDYDTLFFPEDLRRLLLLAVKYPEVDAIVPWQLKRGNHNQSLFGMRNDKGEAVSVLHPSLFNTDMNKIDVGHFGLTLFRTRSFKDLPKPWFLNVPNENGEWRDGKTNADIYFWQKFKEYNKKVYVANSVSLGHLDEMVLSLDKNFQIKKQTVTDYMFSNGENYAD